VSEPTSSSAWSRLRVPDAPAVWVWRLGKGAWLVTGASNLLKLGIPELSSRLGSNRNV
jgi:hypothetical protein